MTEGCIFCKISRGKIPCYQIFEDQDYLVFLDAFPTMKGQVLVIPKKHLGGYLFDLSDEDYVALMRVSKRVARAIDESLGAMRTCMIVEGLDVDHVHVKLYPLFEGEMLNLKDKIELSEFEMSQLSKKIADKMTE